MTADEHLGPAEPVGQPAEGDRQRQVGDVGAHEQQGEPLAGEVVALLQRQVEEAVTDGEHPEHGRGRDDAAEAWLGQAAPGRGDGWGSRPTRGAPRSQVGDEQPEEGQSEQRGGQRGDEHGAVVAGDPPQDRERHERPDRGARRVQSPVHAKGPPQRVLRCRCGDDGVAWCGPQPLAEPVHRDHRGDGRQPLRGDEQGLGDSGQAIAQEGDPLRPVCPVRQPATQDPDQRADALVEPVDEAVGER